MSVELKPQILVIEDDQDLRTILRMQLISEGFAVTEASNGAEGYAAVQEQLPDFVILDLMMPVMDGFSFLKRVRSCTAMLDLPIMILTASEDERNKMRGFQYQADAYMNKPYDLDAVTNEVRRLLSEKNVSA